ncbi:hypothetical protein FF38_12180 [Lucilia cuprina]|uniref:Uncharacterized protein n=1 Tax=Lucilia cuprina TaxID=7375 RepID=A0A0L0BST5_LUCCU|nr:serine/arginine repetitive matrix protein 1 [Lucilia cuprina]XP_046809755.1 serine/arginine repetitive matrix protein 1 [Lucilia cuprina]KNC23043.1 hypothetical protein FF38_12180 [Lucilia cuprina]
MSSSRRRGGMDMNPKLHMDRQPTVTRITDPSLPAGKRREIDNVMKKARANTNDYWDKKLLEVEEKDPNRWRHTGYKKMYIQGESSSGESDRETDVAVMGSAAGGSSGSGYRYNSTGGPPISGGRYGRSRSPRSRSHSRLRKTPPLSPPTRRRSPPPTSRDMVNRISRVRNSPPSSVEGQTRGGRPRSPPLRGGPPRSPSDMGGRRTGGVGRPRSPPEPPIRRKPSRSPIERRRSSPSSLNMGRRRTPPPSNISGISSKQRGLILPRSKRPPSPPPRNSCRSRTNSSVSSCSDDSCSVCSPSHRHRSRSLSLPRVRGGPRSPPPKSSSSRSMHYQRGAVTASTSSSASSAARIPGRPVSPSRGSAMEKYHRNDIVRHISRQRSIDNHSSDGQVKVTRSSRHSPPEDPRLKNRPPEPPEPTTSAVVPLKKKKKEKELRTRIKIEGEKRKKHSSSESDDSGGSDSDETPLPTFTATTRLTLSERFGKMAQWSIDRSNMENMRITKDSAGGALKVMIEEGLESPPRRYSYSPAPVGHFPEELATTAPSGMLSWDDVRVRYEYYKSRGYLRDLDLKDYIKWEEWWYKYQEWLKHERYYEYWERQQLARRRRKKLPITQRLN